MYHTECFVRQFGISGHFVARQAWLLSQNVSPQSFQLYAQGQIISASMPIETAGGKIELKL